MSSIAYSYVQKPGGEPEPMQEGVVLGNTTKFVANSTGDTDERQTWRTLFYQLQDVVSSILTRQRVRYDGSMVPVHRVNVCMRCLRHGSSGVTVLRNSDTGQAKLGGVGVCGSVWTCPVCAYRIAQHRRQELREAVTSWGVSGKSVAMVTLTLQHDRGSDLETLLHDLLEGGRKAKQSRKYRDMKKNLGIVGTVTNLEPTYGKNGWHPHRHELIFSELPQDELNAKLAEIEAGYGKYISFLREKGYYTNEHTIDLLGNSEETPGVLANYLTKWAMPEEMTGFIGKEGKKGQYTVWQLLKKIFQGEKKHIHLFQKYADVFKGKQYLRYSPGLKKLLGIGVMSDTEIAENQEDIEEIVEEIVEDIDDQDDHEIIQEDDDQDNWEVMVHLEWAQYKKVLKRSGQGSIGKLLSIASKGDKGALWSYLYSLGVYATEEQLLFQDRVFH